MSSLRVLNTFSDWHIYVYLQSLSIHVFQSLKICSSGEKKKISSWMKIKPALCFSSTVQTPWPWAGSWSIPARLWSSTRACVPAPGVAHREHWLKAHRWQNSTLATDEEQDSKGFIYFLLSQCFWTLYLSSEGEGSSVCVAKFSNICLKTLLTSCTPPNESREIYIFLCLNLIYNTA